MWTVLQAKKSMLNYKVYSYPNWSITKYRILRRRSINERGEIIVDKHGATNVPGVFAAGDCTDGAYKQIVISMGSGATAALGAFDYMIRN